MGETKYFAFDFETAGLDPSKSPALTAYFAAVDSNFNIIEDLELQIKPEEPYSLIEEEALKVNNIDLLKHISDPKTISRLEAGEKLKEFLKKHKGKTRAKPRPLGHNVMFDIAFTRQLLSQSEWESSVHYGVVCTSVTTTVLKDAGILPEIVGNLSSLVKHFGVEQRNAHTAKDDVLMMIDVYAKMIQMLKANTEGSSDLAVDVLSMLEK